MAKKITIQHYYTTGSSAPTSLELGEIAIAHSGGSEAIYIKGDVKFIPEAQIDKKFADASIASNGVITGLSKQLTEHITNSGTTSNMGHVKLVEGELSGYTAPTDGEAASVYHTHGQYITNITPDSGEPIISLIENGVAKIGLTPNIKDNINSGVTAYGWGNHANAGYAQNKDLTAHTNNDDFHVTKSQKDAWDKAKSDIDAFFNDNATISGAVDTLKEIQNFLTGDDGTVQTLLDNLSALTDTVSGNTQSIDTLEINVRNKVDVVAATGDSLNITLNSDGKEKKYTISHTKATTPTSALTVTNKTALTFGDNLNIINNVSYDTNGHLVSGSTQKISIPTLPTGSTNGMGIVKLVKGDADEYLYVADTYLAAHIAHSHSQYVKFTDLYSGNTSSNITISCGTY